MRRATSIIIGILLGALAAAIGVGFFLKRANDDRAALAERAAQTVKEANKSREQSAQAILAANQKLETADGEVSKAQQIIKNLREENQLLQTATVLPPPTSRATSGWQDVVSLDQGLTLKIPAPNTVETNDASALSIYDPLRQDLPQTWLSFIPYQAKTERSLLGSLSNTSSVALVVDGQLLTGVQGTRFLEDGPVYVLQVHHQGEISHLIWMRTPVKQNTALMVLATLKFKKS